MARKRRNSSNYNKDILANPVKTNSSLDAHIKQLVADAVDKWSVENEKELKLLKTEQAVVRMELTKVKKSQGFISAKYKDLKLEHLKLVIESQQRTRKKIKKQWSL